jgi:hypothetical protein
MRKWRESLGAKYLRREDMDGELEQRFQMFVTGSDADMKRMRVYER